MNFIPLSYTDGAVLVENNFVYLPDDIRAKVQHRSGFLLGVRPEKMQQTEYDVKLVVAVEMWEILGSEKIAYFTINGAKCCAKLSAENPSSKEIELTLAFNNAHYFDNETLLRI